MTRENSPDITKTELRSDEESKQSSTGTAAIKVVSQGGLIPDNVRQSQIRRDTYLSNLMSNRVTERTGGISKVINKAIPMKVRINEHFVEVQKFDTSSDSRT